MTDRTGQKCFVSFMLEISRWTMLHRRPVEVDSDQIKTLIEINQCYTTRVIANILKISKSITLVVKMKNVPFILWEIPRGLPSQPRTYPRANPQFSWTSAPGAGWPGHVGALSLRNSRRSPGPLSGTATPFYRPSSRAGGLLPRNLGGLPLLQAAPLGGF